MRNPGPRQLLLDGIAQTCIGVGDLLRSFFGARREQERGPVLIGSGGDDQRGVGKLRSQESRGADMDRIRHAESPELSDLRADTPCPRHATVHDKSASGLGPDDKQHVRVRVAYRDFFYFRVAVAEPVQHFSDVDVVEDDCPGGKVVQLATLELRLLFQPTDVIARIIYSRAARVARVSV